MAERIWSVTGPKVLELLHNHPDYELVLCGHSLGAGVACLLHVMLQEQKIYPSATCFAFAAPPTYSRRTAGRRCTNYIHQNDVVPFLSVFAIRQYLLRIAAIDEQNLSWSERLRLIRKGTGLEELMESLRTSEPRSLVTKAGAPRLLIPAESNVWIQEDARTGLYTAHSCDAGALAEMGIALELSMFQDHIPSQYEHALTSLLEDE